MVTDDLPPLRQRVQGLLDRASRLRAAFEARTACEPGVETLDTLTPRRAAPRRTSCCRCSGKFPLHGRWLDICFLGACVTTPRDEERMNRLIKAAGAAALCMGAVSAQAALQARDLDSNGSTDAYYDTVLDITWLADWNAGAGSSLDNGGSTTDGRMTWNNANASLRCVAVR